MNLRLAKTSMTPSVIELRRHSELVVGLGAAVLCLLAGALLVYRPPYAVLIGMVVFGLLAVAAAQSVPAAAFVFAALSLALVPVYASPTIGPFLAEPTVLLLAVVLIGLAIKKRALLPRLSSLDRAILLLWGLLFFSTAAHARTLNEFIYTGILWLIPALAARAVVYFIGSLVFVRAIAISALALLPFLAYEALTGHNPFSALALNRASADFWLQSNLRLGTLRVSGSFGHPLALSMFLATACVFCIALAADERESRRRALWIAGTIGLLISLALPLARTGLVVFGVGLIILSIRLGLFARIRIAAIALLVAIAVVVAPQGQSTRELVGSVVGSSPDTSLSSTRDSRVRLLNSAFAPGVLKPLGNKEPHIQGSIDNEYLYLADQWGLVALAGFILLLLLVLTAAFRLRGSPSDVVIPAAAAANLVGLAFVALITQQQILVWLLIGATAGTLGRQRDWTST